MASEFLQVVYRQSGKMGGLEQASAGVSQLLHMPSFVNAAFLAVSCVGLCIDFGCFCATSSRADRIQQRQCGHKASHIYSLAFYRKILMTPCTGIWKIIIKEYIYVFRASESSLFEK